MVQLNFDATTVTPSAPPEALETGWYPATIIMTEMKPTRNNDGEYLEITHRISSGPAQGRTFKSRLNLKNKNQQAVDIAYSELSAICHAVGKLRIGMAAELHGSNLEIFLKKVARSDQPEVMTNDVAGYRALGAHGSQPGFSGAAGSQNASAPAWATAPAAPAAPAAPPPVPAASTFPPEGWTAHPTAAGYYYKGQEVLSEADLRAKSTPAAPAAPTAPAAPSTADAPWKNETAPAAPAATEAAPPADAAVPPWAR